MFKITNLLRKGIKFSTIADEWLEQKKILIKESTYYNYLFIIEKHIKPYFKNLYIKEKLDYTDFVISLSKKLAPKTIKDIVCVLNSILKYYEEKYECKIKIKRANLPKSAKNNLEILTNDEIQKIEKFCINNFSKETLGIVLSLNTGIRIGELCALKWKDINLNEKNIKIQNTVQRVYDKNLKKTKIIVGTAKTNSSRRVIPINKKIYNLLLIAKKIDVKNSDSIDEFFVLSGNEKIIEPRRYQKNFKSILKKCKIKEYHFHILRHTFATECIKVGMDVKSLSEILGHANTNITLNTYVHSTNEMKKKYLEKL